MQAVKKIQLGQYFTKEKVWLKPQVLNFIKNSGCKIAYDPFAGNGDLLKISRDYGISKIKGLDIDFNLSWEQNDSLKHIPPIKNAIIITNPPYLTKYSAKRKKLNINYSYFDKHTDLYQLAVDKILESQDFAVMIIPESYINSNYFNKHLERMHSITILTENPFLDTENPVCVVCFDNIHKDPPKIKVYLDNEYLNDYSYFQKNRLTPKNSYYIRFNAKNGNLALRAIDLSTENKKIRFYVSKAIDYDLSKICSSSRLFTSIDLDCSDIDINQLAKECNNILNAYRQKTHDVLLTPFKGNTKEGLRRRRLDYKTARCIIEMAISNIRSLKYA